MNGLKRTVSRHEHNHERHSKRNFKRINTRDQPKELEQTVQTSDPSKLPPFGQEDIIILNNQGLEICPYMRNITIDRERLLVYGNCALPTNYIPGQDLNTCKPGGSYCPRHRVDPEGQQGCWHYNLIWGKRDLKQR